jgi:hypothetical protein
MTFFALLVALRIALPHMVERWIDDQLRALEGYSGDVDDVDLQLWRGGAVLSGFEIVKQSGDVPVPFLSFEKLDFSVQWSALLEGALVAEGTIYELELNFVEGPNDAASQYGEGVDWQRELLALTPLNINELIIVDGEIHYRDFHAEPPINVYIQNLNATLTNLSNVRDRRDDRPAALVASGLVLDSGRLEFDGNVDVFAASPEFDIDLKIKSLDVRELNDLLKAYVGIDAEGGRFSLYSEVRGHEKSIDGYAKPILDDVEIFESGESGDFFDRAGDAFVGVGLEIIENKPKSRIATRVPVSGSLEDPDANGWVAAFGLIRNAYIDAFSHGLRLNGKSEKKQ